jgi:hypothetical protein
VMPDHARDHLSKIHTFPTHRETWRSNREGLDVSGG